MWYQVTLHHISVYGAADRKMDILLSLYCKVEMMQIDDAYFAL